MHFIRVLSLLAAPGLALCAATGATSLPIVDLGYERHQAISYNSTIGYYNFSNIRFAAPPIGNLRFAEPQAPAVNRGEVQTGDANRICPQAVPIWQSIAPAFVTDYLTGVPFNASSFTVPTSGPTPAQESIASEDCLFLDVHVPKTIFDAGQQNGWGGYGGFGGWGNHGNNGQSNLAPVLVWIYGGGYVEGSKDFDPAGLFVRGDNGFVFVAMNYRVGVFGWASGPTFQESGTANAGLYDQRFALEWVQKYIHLFGGDKDKVTVFGESAGGGSIMHQITVGSSNGSRTDSPPWPADEAFARGHGWVGPSDQTRSLTVGQAYGGLKGPAPFRAAIPQSPGWLPVVSSQEQERSWNNFLALTNVSNIEEARQLPSEVVIAANSFQITYQSAYGNFTYGPAVDGKFVPALPGQLLLHGQFDQSVSIMTGHNSDEGLAFTPFYLLNDTAVRNELKAIFPAAQPYIIDYILDDLYPPIYDGSYGYKDSIGRSALLISEVIFTCNTNYLARAYGNRTYAYRFDIFPALHGEDIAYTFYDDTPLASSSPDGVVNKTVAYTLQEFITSFAIDGKPTSKSSGIGTIPQYGYNANLVNLNTSSIIVQKDETANQRCYWWQKALYY